MEFYDYPIGEEPSETYRLPLEAQIDLKIIELEKLLTAQYEQGVNRRLYTRWTMINNKWVARLIDEV